MRRARRGPLRRLIAGYVGVYAALLEFSINKWNGDEDMASFFTACALMGAAIMNVGLLLGTGTLIWGPLESGYARLIALALVGSVSLANYTLFIHRDRYREALAIFRAYPDAQRKRLTTLAWLYLVPSYAVPIALFSLLAALVVD